MGYPNTTVLILYDYLRSFLSNRFIKAVLTLVSTTLLAHVIQLIATPALTRLYSPSQFGEVAVVMAIASVLLTVSSLRYELAIALPKSYFHSRLLLQLAQRLNLVFAVFLVVVIALLGDVLSTLGNHTVQTSLLWTIPFFVLLAGVFRAHTYMALREDRYQLLGVSKVVQATGTVIVQLILGLTSLGPLGLALGQVVGQGAGAWKIHQVLGLKEHDYLSRKRWRLKRWALARKHRRFPKYDVPASLVDVASVQLPNLLLAAFFSPVTAGLYVLADRVVTLPITFLGRSVGQVLFGFSREALSRGLMLKMALKSVGILLGLILIPTALLFFLGPDLFAMVFGEQWRQAGVYASWLMLGVAVQFVYGPISLLLMATEGQKLNLLIHSTLLVGKFLALEYGHRHNDPLQSIIGFSVVGGAGYFLAIIAILWHLRRQPTSLSVS